jgi:Flp pilus assembly pilin Flp
MKAIKNFINDETGVETLEYAIIAAIVAAVAVLVYGSGWGQQIKDKLTTAANVDTSASLSSRLCENGELAPPNLRKLATRF